MLIWPCAGFETNYKPEVLKILKIFDGSFGTYFFSKTKDSASCEFANISNPDLVLEIHSEYISSGVGVIKTNTFAANSNFISDSLLLENIIKTGFDLATKAAFGTDVEVFADIGPISGDNASDEYQKIADIFINRGAENFLFETLNEAKSLQNTIKHIKSRIPTSTVIISFAVSQDGYTKLGEYYEALFDEAVSYGADYVGLNCICGPSHMLRLIKRLPSNKYNLAAMPNAGYPSNVNGRTVYVDNPDYYSEKLTEIHAHGVDIVGGCCGTTPKHMRKVKERIDGASPQKINEKNRELPSKVIAKNSFQTPKTIIAVEINAPDIPNMTYALDVAKKAKALCADFVTVPDSPLGKPRANSFIISQMLQNSVGINAIPHLCCRDKNQIAIKGDLLAANIAGISNVLAVTGDPVSKISTGDAKHVFGFNSYKLISFIKNLNDTVFGDNPYTICAALNTNTENFDAELKRAEIKIENGANCFFTQPIFTQKNIENYLRAKKTLDCKILAGIMVLASYKNALFLNNEVPGIEIPGEVIKNLKDKNGQDTKDVSISYAKSIVDIMQDNCDGYYIMTSLKKFDCTAELIQYIRRMK